MEYVELTAAKGEIVTLPFPMKVKQVFTITNPKKKMSCKQISAESVHEYAYEEPETNWKQDSETKLGYFSFIPYQREQMPVIIGYDK